MSDNIAWAIVGAVAFGIWQSSGAAGVFMFVMLVLMAPSE